MSSYRLLRPRSARLLLCLAALGSWAAPAIESVALDPDREAAQQGAAELEALREASGAAAASSQLIVSPTNDAVVLASSLIGPGASLVNAYYLGCDPSLPPSWPCWEALSAGTFQGGLQAGLPIDSGVVLTTGLADQASGPNMSPSETLSGCCGTPDASIGLYGEASDPDLEAIAHEPDIHDRVLLHLEFQFDGAEGGHAFFDFVFASEEFIDYYWLGFNDVFAIFVDGEDIGYETVDSTALGPLSYVNNVENPNGFPDSDIGVRYDGLTTLRGVAAYDLSPGSHTLEFRIADAEDAFFDAAVFLSRGRFCPDRDYDLVCDPDDPCPDDPQNDSDGDGHFDCMDNCPDDFNPEQTDSSTPPDGVGDACTPIDYAALGDSYSSGEGNRPYFLPTATSTNACHRSRIGYPMLVEDPDPNIGAPISAPTPSNPLVPQFEPLSDYLACSGAATDNVKIGGTPQAPQSTQDNVSQLDRPNVPPPGFVVNSGTDLITLTIGGNDACFVRLITFCLWKDNCHTQNFRAGKSLTDFVQDLINDGVSGTGVRKNVRETLQQIKTQAGPDTSIILAGYPHAVDGNDQCDGVELPGPLGFFWNISEAEQQALRNDVVNTLNAMLFEVAGEVGVHFVPVASRFEGHNVCSHPSNPKLDWIYGLSIPLIQPLGGWGHRFVKRSFHPNALGQIQYAAAIDEFIAAKRGSAWPLNSAGLPKNPDPGPPAPNGPAAGFDCESSPNPGIGDLEVEPVTLLCATDFGVYGPTQLVRLTGAGFGASQSVSLSFSQPGIDTSLPSTQAAADGSLTVEVAVPATAFSGPAILVAEGTTPGDKRVLLSDPVGIVPSIAGDPDFDGVGAVCDNCPDDPNPNQVDSDDDGPGDACDPCPLDPNNDADGDGICAPDDPDPFLATPCDDGFDNDGDGLIDLADLGCQMAASPREDPQCNDGIDNDGDGLIDLDDPGCGGDAWRIQESPQCEDGVDNDGDSLIDFPADPQCGSFVDDQESGGGGGCRKCKAPAGL